jgi:hypothetical protein
LEVAICPFSKLLGVLGEDVPNLSLEIELALLRMVVREDHRWLLLLLHRLRDFDYGCWWFLDELNLLFEEDHGFNIPVNLLRLERDLALVFVLI